LTCPSTRKPPLKRMLPSMSSTCRSGCRSCSLPFARTSSLSFTNWLTVAHALPFSSTGPAHFWLHAFWQGKYAFDTLIAEIPVETARVSSLPGNSTLAALPAWITSQRQPARLPLKSWALLPRRMTSNLIPHLLGGNKLDLQPANRNAFAAGPAWQQTIEKRQVFLRRAFSSSATDLVVSTAVRRAFHIQLIFRRIAKRVACLIALVTVPWLCLRLHLRDACSALMPALESTVPRPRS
jgi:hypothetical protein